MSTAPQGSRWSACAASFAALLLAASAAAQSGLDSRQFDRYWRVESESPHWQAAFQGDTCELVAPQGLTLWRRQPMQGDCAVEYDVQVADDRLSDMNCFWMASDPAAKDIWRRMAWRSGIFARCYTLQTYYLGYGGNYNTTTRFRRYTGDERGVDSTAYRPDILTEYTDSAHLLLPGHWYHLRLQTVGGRTQMYVDGECIVDYLDPQPLTAGWFGFRTTLSRVRIANFRMEQVRQPSLLTGIPLRWFSAGSCPVPAGSRSTVPVTFGIPFAPGELKDVSRLALSDGSDCDAWVNARWPDGTVKWAGMAATPAIAGSLRVVSAASPRRGTGRDAPAGDPACGGFFFSHEGDAVVDSIVIDGRKVAGAVQLIATTDDDAFVGHVDSAVVERCGQVLTVVRLYGHHRSQTCERRWLPFTVRLYLYKGCRKVKLVHTFVFDGDEQRDFITSLGIRFAVPMRLEPYNRHVAFAATLPEDSLCGVWAEPVQPLDGRRSLSNREAQQWQMEGKRIAPYADMDDRDRRLIDGWAAWDGFRLSQLTDNSFSIRKRATTPPPGNGSSRCSSERVGERQPWIGTFTGRRAPGYVFVGDTEGGLGVYMQDFWQSYPSTIQVDHARSSEAQLTMYLWSPEAEPMNLCHYDTVAHGLDASYEDVQPGLSTPYGIARTTTFWLYPQSAYPGREDIGRQAAGFEAAPRLAPTPEYLHAKRAFGVWSLPAPAGRYSAVEQRLTAYLDYYRDAVEQHKWYGFWNYGDLMHAYDPERHEWRYDVGGYAWDNTELATPMWLWYSFLRTGRGDVWRMAEAMTRHNSEVDTYHLGPLAPLGSRHNVSHWGCGAKEARISQSAFLRFYYYLTGGDERTGELMHAQTDADTLLYRLDPMRLAEPRTQFPCTAPARLRFGPDWLAYAGNWMTEWERTGNSRYRDKIAAGLHSAAAMKHGLFTGNKAWGYDPATGVMSYEGPEDLMNTNHLATIMGGFEVMNELLYLMKDETSPLPHDSFKEVWLDHALRYKQMARDVSRNHFAVRRLMAYGAWHTRSPRLAREAWTDLWERREHDKAPAFSIERLTPPAVPAPRDYWHGLTTNDAALWSLDAIYMLETIGNAFRTK